MDVTIVRDLKLDLTKALRNLTAISENDKKEYEYQKQHRAVCYNLNFCIPCVYYAKIYIFIDFIIIIPILFIFILYYIRDPELRNHKVMGYAFIIMVPIAHAGFGIAILYFSCDTMSYFHSKF